MLDFDFLQKDFPVLQCKMHGKPLVYLDSAATAQKPQSVIDAIVDFYTNHYGTVHRAVYQLSGYATECYDNVREKVRKFINAKDSREIIYTKGTTDGINLVANSFSQTFMQAGDEIIISILEHHSNILPWQIISQRCGYILKVIHCNDNGELNLEEYGKLLNDRTKIVAIAHVANSIGTINPIKKIISMAHDFGAKVLVDGAQAVPHMSVDVLNLDADFYVFSGHKMYGPTGVGILYGKEVLLQQMEPYQVGGDMVETVTINKSKYNEIPSKFEAGTPAVASIIGMGAAINYLNSIGMKNILEHDAELLEYATSKLLEADIKGLKILGPDVSKKSSIISFVIEGAHPLDIGTMLDLKGIAVRTGQHCAQPALKCFRVDCSVRVSFALYNNKADVDLFILALNDILAKLR